MANVTLSAFKAALKTLLEAQTPALDGVTIHLRETTVPDRSRKHIVLGDAAAFYEHHAMGGAMLETTDLAGHITVKAKDADTALTEVEGYLEAVAVALTTDDWTVGSSVLDADLVQWESEEEPDPDQGARCRFDFIIRYRQTNQ